MSGSWETHIWIDPHTCAWESTSHRATSVPCAVEQQAKPHTGAIQEAKSAPPTWARESLSECAGSVDTTSVVWPSSAKRTAREAARLVLPTPPLPLTMMYLRPVPAESWVKALATGSTSVLETAFTASRIPVEGLSRQRDCVMEA